MTEFSWRNVANEHPYSTVAFFLAIIVFILIAIYAIAGVGELTGLERQVYFMFIGVSTVLIALGFGLILVFEKMQLKAVGTILGALPKHEEPEIRVIADPNDIWRHSIELLTKLIHEERAENKHAYDVTTYMNRIRYEEQVANVLDNGIRFDRIFCYDDSSDRASDQAIKWFSNKIIEGGEVEREDIEDFESEIARAFNGSGQLTDENLKKLNEIIARLHEARAQKKLRIGTLRYPQHTDFVVVKYTPRDAETEVHEVVANFKTDPTGLTYTIGIHGTKRIALEYKNMFENVLGAGL